MEVAAAVVIGYLLGSIPVGLIVSRLSGGVDVRDYGSGKTGFTNSLRELAGSEPDRIRLVVPDDLYR